MTQNPIKYPNDYDDDTNLYLAGDSLRVVLASDYNPGDTSITIFDDNNKMANFPNTGIITLTEQASDIKHRAISFYYTSKTNNTFNGLTKLPRFEDCVKLKNITNVTLNVIDEHHNNLKDSLIAVENVMGTENSTDENTLSYRIKHLTEIVFTPRIWFKSDKQKGLGPLEVTFTPQCFRLGSGEVEYTFHFGDSTISTITVDATEIPSITKVYTNPGKYNVQLAVTNAYGSDSMTIPEMIRVISTAPEEAILEYIPGDGQRENDIVYLKDSNINFSSYSIRTNHQGLTPWNVTIDGNNYEINDIYNGKLVLKNSTGLIVSQSNVSYTMFNQSGSTIYTSTGILTVEPRIRAPIGSLINFQTKVGMDHATGMFTCNIRRPKITSSGPEYSYAGEKLTGVGYYDSPTNNYPVSGTGSAIDPIVSYTWSMSDDLQHANTNVAKALYSVGGLYDLILRTDTNLGGYRITSIEQSLDIVEGNNLWLWNYNPAYYSDDINYRYSPPGSTAKVVCHEYGLFSETFKTSNNLLNVTRDDSFLNGTNNEIKAKNEFRRNTGFAPKGVENSGSGGNTMLYWANESSITSYEYNAFTDVYTASTGITHPWNWICLSSPYKSYFLFGSDPASPANENLSCQTKDVVDFLSGVSSSTLALENYSNGADELMNHPSSYDSLGAPSNGYFAVYRTAWKDNSGFIVRNTGVSWSFRLQSFYQTQGTDDDPVMNIIKLPDVEGPVKTEGQLVTMANGIFFFNNSGNIAAYDNTAGVWQVGGPSQSSVAFSSLQDISVSTFNQPENTLLATSDKNYTAFLSYDYSPNTLIKFNLQDRTFQNAGARPNGPQFIMGIY